MIFVIEHEEGTPYRFQILIDVDEVEPKQFDPIKNLFLCETIDEAVMVVTELQEMSK